VVSNGELLSITRAISNGEYGVVDNGEFFSKILELSVMVNFCRQY